MLSIESIVRGLARILSVGILLFWGYFLTMHLIGDEGSPSRALTTGDYILIATMLTSLVGLAVAWKWELVGGALTIAAVLIGATINWRVLTFPFTLIPIVAVLFLSSWWMSKSRRGMADSQRSHGLT